MGGGSETPKGFAYWVEAGNGGKGWPDKGCCLGLLSRRKRALWGSGQGLLQKVGEGAAEGLLAWGWKGAVRFESWAPGKGDFEGLCLLKGLEVWGQEQCGEERDTGPEWVH